MDKDLLNNDPWLASLYWLTAHFGLRRHPQQLLAGLPLENNKLNAELFPRAASQIGLDVDEQPLLPFQPERLPVLAIDKNGLPVLIVGCDLKNIVLLLPSDSGMIEQTLPRNQLEERFETSSKQKVWSVAAQHVTDQRADELTPSKPRHWLIQAMLEAKPWYRDLLVASLVINLLALIIPLFTMNVYDRVVPNQAFDTLWVLALGAAVALLFDWLLRKARSGLTDMAGRQIDVKISSMLYAKVLGMKLENRPQSAGAFAKQIQEFDSVREFLTSATLTTAIDLPFTFLFLGLIAWLGGPMVLVPIVAVGVLLLLSWFLQKKIKGTLEESSRLSTHRQALLIEQLQLLPDTKQHNAEGAALRRWEQTVASLSDWQVRGREYSNTLSYTVMNMQNLVVIGLIITGVYRISEGLMTMGGLIAVVMLSGRAASAINQLAMLLMRYEQTRTAIDGLESVMALPQEQHPQQTMTRKEFTGKTELRHASFSYPEHNQPALSEISLSLQPGECVGVLGAAGAGKSTLLALLSGQYIPTQGQVFYDGIESQQWPVNAIRARTGWVSQSPVLIFGSVLDNLCFGLAEVEKTALEKVLQTSGIMCFADRLENGLETQVGELGRNLSGGQRQAVTLGRALLRESSLLILDEPCSAMDQTMEAQVIAGLKNPPADRCTVIATHKPSFLQLCDRLIVLDRGRIVADGPTATVLAQQSREQKIKEKQLSEKQLKGHSTQPQKNQSEGAQSSLGHQASVNIESRKVRAVNIRQNEPQVKKAQNFDSQISQSKASQPQITQPKTSQPKTSEVES